nr:MAG TPA: hypothetical protein [Caudoviricetes sp.]
MAESGVNDIDWCLALRENIYKGIPQAINEYSKGMPVKHKLTRLMFEMRYGSFLGAGYR